jgi:hypothetical protein
MATGVRWSTTNTAAPDSGTVNPFTSDTFALGQVEDLANQANLLNTTVLATATINVMTAAQFVNGLFTLFGTGGAVIPSAASIVDSIVNVQTGSAFEVWFHNQGTSNMALLNSGGGVTFFTDTCTSVPTLKKQWLHGVVTNPIVGAEAVQLVTMLTNGGV